MRIDSRMNIKWEVMEVNWVVDVRRFIISLRKNENLFDAAELQRKNFETFSCI